MARAMENAEKQAGDIEGRKEVNRVWKKAGDSRTRLAYIKSKAIDVEGKDTSRWIKIVKHGVKPAGDVKGKIILNVFVKVNQVEMISEKKRSPSVSGKLRMVTGMLLL
jgi:translation initiation factor IF-1